MIAIKGMEMPEACCDCPCISQSGLHCDAIEYGAKKFSFNYGRPKWCPLIEIKDLDSGYVCKTETNEYYCGYNRFDKQLRMAKIYHSLKYAQEAKETMEERTNHKINIIKIKMREAE